MSINQYNRKSIMMNQQENAEVLSVVEENVNIVKKTKKVIKKGSPIIVVEKEVVVEKTEDEELEELRETIRQATKKANELQAKKDLQQNSGRYLDKLKVSKNNALEINKLKMVVLQAENECLVEEIEALEGINVDEDDVTGFLTENYADFIEDIAFPATKSATKSKAKGKGKAKAKKVKTDDDVSSLSSTESKSKQYAERKDQWKQIPEGTKLVMTYNKSGRIYTKKGDGLIGEDETEYKSMNDAIRQYKKEIGDLKSFGSAWNLFKVV